MLLMKIYDVNSRIGYLLIIDYYDWNIRYLILKMLKRLLLVRAFNLESVDHMESMHATANKILYVMTRPGA